MSQTIDVSKYLPDYDPACPMQLVEMWALHESPNFLEYPIQ